jgi:hypothetical protein
MPISEEFESVPMMGNVVGIPTTDNIVFISLQIMNGGSATEAQMDEILQSVVDLFQGWEFRHPTDNVLGQKYITGFHRVSPVNPVSPTP